MIHNWEWKELKDDSNWVKVTGRAVTYTLKIKTERLKMMSWKKGSQWWCQKRVTVFGQIQTKKVKFPILFYIDITQLIEKKVVAVRTENGEGLDR